MDASRVWTGSLFVPASQPLSETPSFVACRKKLVQRVVGNASASDGRPKWHEDV